MKKFLIALVLLGLIGAGIGYTIYNKPHENISRAEAEQKLTANELFSAYESNEAAANTSYLDKVIEVTGTVRETSVGDDGIVNIILDSDDMMFGVRCQLDNLSKHKRTEFKTGEKITLKGKCTGSLMDVVIVRCVEM